MAYNHTVGERIQIYRATVTSKGQITIPRAVRERLGVREGDQIEFLITGPETVARPVRRYRAADLPGALMGSSVPFPGIDAEKEALARALADKDAQRCDSG
jgi:AbrB family looped-hinge helix DNA binding protein